LDIAFFVLLWIASPQGGFSEIFGAKEDCIEAHKAVVEASNTLYASECIEVQMKFIKSVKQEYQRPSDIPPLWRR